VTTPKEANMAKRKTAKPINREEWLQRALDLLRPMLAEADADVPKVHVSTGFPSIRGVANSTRRIGECWTKGGEDKVPQILISPTIVDHWEVVGTLVHEAIHAAHPGAGHKGPFPRTCKKLGMSGKPTQAGIRADSTLADRIEPILKPLGAYPHVALIPPGPKQKSRQLKLVCTSCDFIARASMGAIDEHGFPEHCGEEMHWALTDGILEHIPVKEAS
jgi:hypothetical protein